MDIHCAPGNYLLIISSQAYVSPAGQAGPWQLGVYNDALVPGLETMTKAVHDNGGKIVMQNSASRRTGIPGTGKNELPGFYRERTGGGRFP